MNRDNCFLFYHCCDVRNISSIFIDVSDYSHGQKMFTIDMKRVTFYENNELNRNWNSLFEDIFECNNLIKIENVHLDLCCKVRLLWIALMILNHRFIQEKKNWSWRYILKPKQEVFVSDAENCYQFFLSNVIFLLHLNKSFIK